MVVPCIPCAAAAVPVISTSIATVFGVGATAVAAKKLMKTKKKKKSKKNIKKDKNKDKKKKHKNKDKKKKHKHKDKKKKDKTIKKSMKGGDVIFTKEMKNDMRKIFDKNSKCRNKCSNDIMKIKLKKQRLSHSIINNQFDRFEGLSSEDKKEWNKQRVERNRCWSKCDKFKKDDNKLHKKKFYKEYREINKENKENCCRCHYVKKGKSLRRVRGPYSHCSYDSNNCCKDKKTIVKSKK
jgi:hypothetical protein